MKYGYQHYGWPDLRASLIHTFSSGSDIVSQLRTVSCSESNEFATYADYVMEKTSQINRLPFDIPEDKVVKIIVGCISDISLRNSLTFVMPTSVQNLIEHLSSIRERPRPKFEQTTRRFTDKPNTSRAVTTMRENLHSPPPKRTRATEDKRCFECGKLGHIRSNCPKQYNSVSKTSKENKVINKPDAAVICDFCTKAGHSENMCWAKQRAERKNVNICRNPLYNQNQTPVIIKGKLYHCLLDTGSDCSLIRSDVADLIQIEKRPRFLLVQGIGGKPVLLTQEFETLVEFEDIIIEVNFHVIDQQYLNNEIIIGRDVLKDKSLKISVDSRGSTMHRANPIECVRSYFASAHENQSKLDKLLQKYSSNIITGLPKSEVTTGSLEIKLLKDVNVYYRPYRMAESERKATADIIANLKQHRIIRDSSSPFASPVILVKKKMERTDFASIIGH